MVNTNSDTECAIVRAICEEADLLVATDTGNADLEVLEGLRLKMNDSPYAKDFDHAVLYAEIIALRHAGRNKAADVLEQTGT